MQVDSFSQAAASSPAHATALHLEWNDTTSGPITESDIEWTPSNSQCESARRPRQPFDHGNHFTISGVAPSTIFRFGSAIATSSPARVEPRLSRLHHGGQRRSRSRCESDSSGSVLVAQATLGTDGTFSVLVTIPAGTSAGAYNLPHDGRK